MKERIISVEVYKVQKIRGGWFGGSWTALRTTNIMREHLFDNKNQIHFLLHRKNMSRIIDLVN